MTHQQVCRVSPGQHDQSQGNHTSIYAWVSNNSLRFESLCGVLCYCHGYIPQLRAEPRCLTHTQSGAEFQGVHSTTTGVCWQGPSPSSTHQLPQKPTQKPGNKDLIKLSKACVNLFFFFFFLWTSVDAPGCRMMSVTSPEKKWEKVLRRHWKTLDLMQSQ